MLRTESLPGNFREKNALRYFQICKRLNSVFVDFAAHQLIQDYAFAMRSDVVFNKHEDSRDKAYDRVMMFCSMISELERLSRSIPDIEISDEDANLK